MQKEPPKNTSISSSKILSHGRLCHMLIVAILPLSIRSCGYEGSLLFGKGETSQLSHMGWYCFLPLSWLTAIASWVMWFSLLTHSRAGYSRVLIAYCPKRGFALHFLCLPCMHSINTEGCTCVSNTDR